MKKLTSKLYFALICLVCIIEVGFAQDKLYFQSLSVNDGLSQNNVVAIAQDLEGFIWFGTKNGLNCYDGNSFQVFEGNETDNKALSYSRINSLAVDYKDRVWIATEGKELNWYSKKAKRFHTITAETNSNFKGTQVHNILSDEAGEVIWVLTEEGLNKIDASNLSVSFIPLSPLNQQELIETAGLFKDRKGRFLIGIAGGDLLVMNPDGSFVRIPQEEKVRINGFAQKDNGEIWFITQDQGAFVLNEESLELTKPILKDGKEISTNRLISILKDAEGNIWIGTENQGIDILYKESGELINYQYDPEDNYSLANNSIHSIYQDISGRIWLGTFNQGVSYWDSYGVRFQTYRHKNKEKSLSSNAVSVFEQGHSAATVWVGTDGGGLNLWNRKDDTFESFQQGKDKGFTSNAILALYKNNHEGLWIGTWGGGLMYKKQGTEEFLNYETLGTEEERPLHVFQIIPDEKENLWLATFDKGLCYYDLKSNRIISFMESGGKAMQTALSTCLAINHKKEIWVGTIAGLYKFTPNKDGTYDIKLYSQLEELGGKLPNNFIQTLYSDKKGRLWIGTGGGGLGLYQEKSDDFQFFTKAEGLPSNTIFSIEEDESNLLWVSSSRGLFNFHTDSHIIKVFDIKDGLQDLSFSKSASITLSNGEMLFGGVSGFNTFFPSKIKDNPALPKLYFTDLKVFNQSVAVDKAGNGILDTPLEYAEQLELDYNQSVFTIEFVGVSFTHPERNQYAYKLEGLEDDWNYVGNKTSATYTNLDGGKYTFMLKAANNDGLWTEAPRRLTIIITPPWWETRLFRIGSILFLTAIAVFFYRMRVRRLKVQKARLEKTVAQRTIQLTEKQNEVEAQNEELHQQSEEIMAQRDAIQVQNATLGDTLIEVQEKNRQITDSIRYAENIQQSILPSNERISQLFDNYFIVYTPKDIVSGDFYWATERDGYTFLAVIDCTGHGVPGAFMSMIGNTLLNRIVKEQKVYNPKDILHELNIEVGKSLRQKTSKNSDGMDISIARLSALENDNYEICFAGAKNHLYTFKASENYKHQIIKGTRKSIGGIYNQGAEYKEHIIRLEKDDIFLLSSDGIIDLEVAKSKRLGTKKFMELAENNIKDLEQFKLKLLETIAKSQEEFQPRDDIAVFGVKL